MPDDPYAILCTRLSVLAAEISAHVAAVLDEGGQLYGASDVLDPGELRELGVLFDEIVASADRPLHRGGHVHFGRMDQAPYVVAESFAGIYVLVLLFEQRPKPNVWLKMQKSLSDIEAHTVSLPPDDPGAGSGAGAKRR